MFIEIKSGSEIFYASGCEGIDGSNFGNGTYTPHDSFLVNLNHVQKIHIGKMPDNSFIHLPFGDYGQTKEKQIGGNNYIGFYIPDDAYAGSVNSFTLVFEESAIGEFERIKRIIDTATSK